MAGYDDAYKYSRTSGALMAFILSQDYRRDRTLNKTRGSRRMYTGWTYSV